MTSEPADLTIYLHTVSADRRRPDSLGRTTTGGGAYVSGAPLAAADITDAVDGDIVNTAAIDFGTATANVGTVTLATARIVARCPGLLRNLTQHHAQSRRLVPDRRQLHESGRLFFVDVEAANGRAVIYHRGRPYLY